MLVFNCVLIFRFCGGGSIGGSNIQTYMSICSNISMSKSKISLYVWPCLNDKTHAFWTKRSNIYLDFGVFGTKHTFRFRWYLPSDLRKSSKKHQKTNVTSKCMYVRLPFLNGFYHAFRVKHSNIFVGMSIQKRPKLKCMFQKRW